MKWRIAEVTDPAAPEYLPFNHAERRLYEAEATWESPELTTFARPSPFPPPPRGRAPPVVSVSNTRTHRPLEPLERTGPVRRRGARVSLYLQSLVVSQFMYNPAPPSAQEAAVASDSDAYEWIELMNVGQSPLDLTPVRFTKGIDFDFAGSTVDHARSRASASLVVKNLAAFNARYAGQVAGLAIAGEWQAGDSLSNGGEQIKLSFGAGTADSRLCLRRLAPMARRCRSQRLRPRPRQAGVPPRPRRRHKLALEQTAVRFAGPPAPVNESRGVRSAGMATACPWSHAHSPFERKRARPA